jgi:glycosyltransferase involved in cell wall biosynthesis
MPFLSTQIDASAVFVVVPAYNEEATIATVVDELLSHHFSVVVVDDGSTNSLEVPLSGRSVYLLRHAVNLGQGAALQTGIKYALQNGAVYIVTFDADGQHKVSGVHDLFNVMNESDADIVLGSRFLQSPASQVPFWRRQLLQVARWINFLFTGLYLTDAHNGLRLMNRRAAEQIVLQQNGMAHATEILWQIKIHRLRYKEAPVQVLYTDYSIRKGQNGWSGFRIVLDLLLHKLFR